MISEERPEQAPTSEQSVSDRESNLIRGLRLINQFVQTLEHSSNLNDLCREAVLFARTQLGAERCGLYLMEKDGLRGTWGTDTDLQPISESDNFIPHEQHYERWSKIIDEDLTKWSLLRGPLLEWQGGQLKEIGQGWIARTAIHSNGKLIGVLFNDTAISGAPPDDSLQELLTVFGGLLGQMIEVQRAREDSRRREADLRLLMEHLPDIVARYDRHARHLYISPQLKHVTGFKPEDVIGKRWGDLPLTGELTQVWDRKVSDTFATGKPQVFEFDLPSAMGNRRILARLIPEFVDGATEPVTALGVLSDVTEQRRAEEALIHSERRYRRAITQAGLIPYERQLDNDHYDYIGDDIERVLGIPPSEVTLSGIRSMIVETRLRGQMAVMELAEAYRLVREGKLREWSADLHLKNRRGEDVWLADCSVMTWDENAGSYWILGFLQDMTERMRVEADLITSQRRLSLLNRIARSIHGDLSLSEILSHILAEVRSFMPAYRVSYSKLTPDKKLEVLCSRQPPDYPSTEGYVFDCSKVMDDFRNSLELTPSIVNDSLASKMSSDYRQLTESMVARAWLTVAIQHDEKSVGILSLVSKTPHMWEDSELRTMLEIAEYLKIVLRDCLIREQREATERALQESRELLMRSQKMDAIARLAGGIAHDFNNLLTVISGNIELIADDLAVENRKVEGIADVRNAVARATSLTSQLLNYGRRQFVQPVVFKLEDRFEMLDRLLRRSIREDIDYSVDIQPGIWPIRADPGQIEQMIVNLVVNACEVMPNGGRLSITACNSTLDEDGAKSWQGIHPGRHVMITVRDTGIGIPTEALDKLFEPFFSTKESPAAGLGLASAFGIVKKFDGDIRVESATGQGTTFSILFPASAEADKTPEEQTAPRNPYGRETILFVEDEASLLAMAARTLRAFGYRVLEANSGEEAIEVYNAMGRDVAILVTDVVMPGMSGSELARTLTTGRPDLPVLYISGYSDEEMVRRGIERGRMNFLGKPFNPRALGERIRAILDATPQTKS